jgi:glycosyltransferase involved in cell wall biosynthesis
MTQLVSHVISHSGRLSPTMVAAFASLSDALRLRGDRFILFATDVPGSAWIQVLAEQGHEVRVVRNQNDLAKQLHQLRPDIIHTHFTGFDLTAARANHARIFWHIHSLRSNRSPLARVKGFAKYRLIGSRVEAIVAVSRAVSDECVFFGSRPDRVRTVYNGIDTEYFSPPTGQQRAAARARYGIPPEDRIVLFFDRAPYKGGSTVRKALAMRPELRALIAGATGAKADAFKSMSNVRIAARSEDPRELYWAADALAFASIREAFGLVVVEALACGIPVAVSDIPTTHEICDGLGNAFFFSPGNSQELADALHRALASPSSDAGRARVIQRFSLERWTLDMLALY